ncbi:MAG: hypothetical protein K0M63_10470 [Weeksellaceae bacterium]|nr:hypothetical protein [Weeksellaceae bacterium]
MPIPDVKKYFETKRNSVFSLILTVTIFLLLILFTEYREWSLRIGIFAALFGLYKLYKVITEPQVMLDAQGVHFRTVSVYWKDIRRIILTFEKTGVRFHVDFENGKKMTEAIDNFPLFSYFDLKMDVRSFKKKFRKKFVLKQ